MKDPTRTKSGKRLRLARETVRALTARELVNVAGGIGSWEFYTCSCPPTETQKTCFTVCTNTCVTVCSGDSCGCYMRW